VGGIALLVFTAAFALWSRLRSVVIDPGAAVAGDDDRPPGTEKDPVLPTPRRLTAGPGTGPCRPAAQPASTVTGTRCTRLFAMPCRFQTCSVG
jgi:hypothetical protein